MNGKCEQILESKREREREREREGERERERKRKREREETLPAQAGVWNANPRTLPTICQTVIKKYLKGCQKLSKSDLRALKWNRWVAFGNLFGAFREPLVRELLEGEEVWRRGAQKWCPAPPPRRRPSQYNWVGFFLLCFFPRHVSKT